MRKDNVYLKVFEIMVIVIFKVFLSWKCIKIIYFLFFKIYF